MSMTDMVVARGGVHQHLGCPSFSSTGGRWSDSQVLVLVKDHRDYMTPEEEAEVDRLMGVGKQPDILVTKKTEKRMDCFDEALRKCKLPSKPLTLKKIKIYRAKRAGYWSIRVSFCNMTHYYPGVNLKCNVLKERENCLNIINNIIKERNEENRHETTI